MNQELLRKEITIIRNNGSLSADEKRRAIQRLMTGTSNVLSKITEESNKICKHYEKKCSQFYFACCNVSDSCHRCHAEKRDCQVKPPNIISITCDVCGHPQEPNNICRKCNTKFGENYCNLCKIWTKLRIFHCNGCGICRVGDSNAYFHCDQCNACFNISAKGSGHVCLKRPMNELNCPVCLESVHSSQKSPCIARCGHVFHAECMRASRDYRCPICRKSMYDMEKNGAWASVRKQIAMQPMPRELYVIRVRDVVHSPFGKLLVEQILNDGKLYSGSLVDWMLTNGKYAKAVLACHSVVKKLQTDIFCYDCGVQNMTEFHYVALMCPKCKGYNTTRA